MSVVIKETLVSLKSLLVEKIREDMMMVLMTEHDYLMSGSINIIY